MSSIRHLLSSKVRSQSGCYTCRLRRKKCDERRPVCTGCAALEISCYFGEEKPEWMDGGVKQKQMAEFVKSQVKKQASQRRDRKYLEMLETGTRKVDLNAGDDAFHANSDMDMGYNSTSAPSNKESPNSHGSGSTTATSPPEAPWHTQIVSREDEDQTESSRTADVHYACIFMDYVFPHLFPHYRPHLLVGGRGWVLDMLQSGNKSLYYITMSLSSYYFALILNNGDAQHIQCLDEMNTKLQDQMELGLRELQKEVSSLDHSKLEARDGLVVMQSMIQLLIFEAAAGNRETWKVHLDAAVSLFRQILPNPNDWPEMLQGLYNTSWPPPEMGMKRPWSTQQASCRFFTANLIYIDVLASVTLGASPRLYNYQEVIIPECKGLKWDVAELGASTIHMEEFRGLHNWVIQMIGDIASLHAWKKSQSLAGSLSVTGLVSRGQVLNDAIKGALQAITVCPSGDTLGTVISLPVLNEQPSYNTHNTIWLNAALIYLHTVISGWQPACPEVRDYVSATTDLLYNLPKGTSLGALAWPFCIAGCLAPPEEEYKYREMVDRLGTLQIFGTVREAMDVIERVQALRPLDETWDVSQCMNVLGHGVLLI